MEFTLAGFDVYTAQANDKGIDFVVRKDETAYYDVQVKSARGTNYIFMQKDKFNLIKNLLAAIVRFEEGKTQRYTLSPLQSGLIPTACW